MKMELLDQDHLVPELKVPLAFDENARLVRPEVASKKSTYFCPSCGDLLILKKGEIKQAHFSHKASGACLQETINHKLAKALIVQVINDWKAGKGEAPTVKRQCPECGTYKIQKIPQRVTGAIAERKLDSGYIADVALLENQGTVAAVVEVKVRHAVDERKKTNIGIPFIEVLGEEIIEQPLEWNPITDRFDRFKCKTCAEALVAYQSRIQTISEKTKVPIPDTYFRTAYDNCQKCGKEILIFVWPVDSTNGYQTAFSRPGEFIYSQKLPSGTKKPKTIQFRCPETGGTKYWANTCPYCNSIQDDFFLFLFNGPDSPLFHFSCRGNTEEEFNSDMRSLAIRYFRGWRGTPTR
jgi:Competence protein CoiA-like family